MTADTLICITVDIKQPESSRHLQLCTDDKDVATVALSDKEVVDRFLDIARRTAYNALGIRK